MEGGRLFEAWKRSLDATIEVPDCEPAINAPSPRGKREPRVGGGRGERWRRRRTTPPCASSQEKEEGGIESFERRRKRRARGKGGE